ncbi:MAG: hypothetical protein MJZ60_06935 [Bacteroidaceae bacterium]|nr:hypothetical protein [Bacteroidaceae bacterium]
MKRPYSSPTMGILIPTTSSCTLLTGSSSDEYNPIIGGEDSGADEIVEVKESDCLLEWLDAE